MRFVFGHSLVHLLSTFDTFFDSLHICLTRFCVDLLGFGWIGGLSSHICPPAFWCRWNLPIGLFCFTRYIPTPLIFFALSSNPCLIWTVYWGLCSVLEVSFYGSMSPKFFIEGSKTFWWTWDHFHVIWIAWSTNIIGSLRSYLQVAVFPTAIVWRFLRTFVCPLVTCFIGEYKKL